MLDIKFIRQNPDKVKEGAQNKGVKVDIDKLLELDEKRRKYLKKIEDLRFQQNKLGKNEIKKAKEIKSQIKENEPWLEKIEKDFQDLMLKIPNLPLDDVPVGKDERGNAVLRKWGEQPKFDFKPKDYLEIAENLDLIDVKRAAKVVGTRFGYLKNEAVLLEFALINFTFDTLTTRALVKGVDEATASSTKEKFTPVIPPVMIKPEMARGMGHLEQTGEEAYFLPKDNLYLVGTSEQTMGTMHAGEIFKEKDLPKRYLGFSTCFRREAGAYGKDTKGIFRVHQFDKIEMFNFCKPEDSKKEHQFFLFCQEKLMQLLKIPYRVIQICTGDLGFPAAAAYDIEAWLPSENRYRETHTTFNDTDFQTRRLNIRYQDSKTKKLEFTHALNGTAFAIGRTLIAIIENYQQKDGTIKVPEVLQKYLKLKEIK